MGSMKVAVLTEPGQFEVVERPVPDPGPGEALIRVVRTGVCGTDLHIFKGHYASDSLPLVPGHEFCGEIAALGPGVGGLDVGARAVVDTNVGCGTCFFCLRNEILNCPHMRQLGITRDGAFAEYIAVPARLVIQAPDETPWEVLTLTEPLACVVRAARHARVTFGQSALVIGAGPIGNLHVQLLRAIGVAPIICADINEARVALAREVGADVGVSDPARLEEAVRAATAGRGADLVIESVGQPALYREAWKLARKGGHVAAFGLTGPDGMLELPILSMILEERSIAGSVAGMGLDMHDALTLLAHGRIDVTPFTGADYPLADIQAAFESMPDRPGDLKTQIVMG